MRSVNKLCYIFVLFTVILQADPEEVERFLRDVPGDGSNAEPVPVEGMTEPPHEEREVPQDTGRSASGAEGGEPTDWAPTSRTSGELTTPLGVMLGFTIPPAWACLICDEQFINWPLPDHIFKVVYFTSPWLTLGEKIRSGDISVETDVVAIAVAPDGAGKTAKATVFTWVHDVMDGLRAMCKRDTDVFIATMLPRAPPRQMECINFNRNLANGIRRWNRINPCKFAKYVGWHKIVLEQAIPEDGVWEQYACDMLRLELLRMARL